MNVFKAMKIHYFLYCSDSKMLKLLLFLTAYLCIPFVISWRGLMLGPGEWLVLNIGLCENPEKYELDYEITRKKINRTHESFDIIVDLDREVNSSYGILVDVYKEVDGGFKYFQSLSDDCACSYVMKHAEANLKRGYRMVNIDPPDCPYGPRPIALRNFVMDYRELPKHAIYGTFQAYAYATFQKKKVACIKIILNFDQRNDDDDFSLI